MSETLLVKYKVVVSSIFNQWTALRMAVEHGQGGANGLETALKFVDYVAEFFSLNNNVEAEEIQDILEDVMDQELDTVCEDDSPKEISLVLLRLLNSIKAGRQTDVEAELNTICKSEVWLRAGAKVNFVTAMESSDSEEDEAVNSPSDKRSQPLGPSTSGSTVPMESEEMDFGWTTVESRRKK